MCFIIYLLLLWLLYFWLLICGFQWAKHQVKLFPYASYLIKQIFEILFNFYFHIVNFLRMNMYYIYLWWFCVLFCSCLCGTVFTFCTQTFYTSASPIESSQGSDEFTVQCTSSHHSDGSAYCMHYTCTIQYACTFIYIYILTPFKVSVWKMQYFYSIQTVWQTLCDKDILRRAAFGVTNSLHFDWYFTKRVQLFRSFHKVFG